MSCGTFTSLQAGVSVATQRVPVITVLSQTQQDIVSVTLDAGSAGRYLMWVWLADSDSTPDVLTKIGPSGLPYKEWRIVTDDDGTKTFTIEHTEDVRDWYVCAAIIGLVSTPDSIKIGLTVT